MFVFFILSPELRNMKSLFLNNAIYSCCCCPSRLSWISCFLPCEKANLGSHTWVTTDIKRLAAQTAESKASATLNEKTEGYQSRFGTTRQ